MSQIVNSVWFLGWTWTKNFSYRVKFKLNNNNKLILNLIIKKYKKYQLKKYIFNILLIYNSKISFLNQAGWSKNEFRLEFVLEPSFDPIYRYLWYAYTEAWPQLSRVLNKHV